MRYGNIAAIAVLIVVVAATVNLAEVPTLINYQGLLTDNFGNPVANGTHEVTFRIYDEVSTQRWSEVHNVITTGGLFSVQLGSNGSPLEAGTFDYAECWLGITISGSAELSPRTRIVSVPYALRPATVDGATGGKVTGPVDIESRGLNTAEYSNPGLMILNEGTGFNVIGVGAVASASGAMSGELIGVYGTAGVGNSGNKIGVKGFVQFTGMGYNIGVYGEANSMNGAYGVFGKASTSDPNSYAGYFDGNVHVTGHLTGGTLVSQIDHPSDPENMYLQLSAVESPELKTVYDGVAVLDATGGAVVALPNFAQALNNDFRYQLTCIGGYAPVYVASEMSEGKFRIAGGTAGLKVSWQISGVRKDAFAVANPTQVEMLKAVEDRGKFCHPSAFGQPESAGIDSKFGSELRIEARK
jgi:hypothetical protein